MSIRLPIRPILRIHNSTASIESSLFRRSMATQADSQTPIEDSIRQKITSAFNPSHLDIHNDSALHRHHAAMRGNTNPETHFRITVVSSAFAGKKLPARHRLIYDLLKDEMMPPEGTIHALQMSLKTDEEIKAAAEKAQANASS